jgi:6-pyruvoyltetrahydropterin/6-carboxytetrahydropterin synthase
MLVEKYRSTKSFWNYPCAHRQWKHDGHCRFVHGYSRSFHFLFEAYQLDTTGFVMDFSGLKVIKSWLDENFDHTLLLNADDPLLDMFRAIEAQDGAKIVIVPSGVSMEGTAKWVYDTWAPLIHEQSNGEVRLIQVEVRENDKNSGIYNMEPV